MKIPNIKSSPLLIIIISFSMFFSCEKDDETIDLIEHKTSDCELNGYWKNENRKRIIFMNDKIICFGNSSCYNLIIHENLLICSLDEETIIYRYYFEDCKLYINFEKSEEYIMYEKIDIDLRKFL